MSIDLADYENKAREAARQKQIESGKADQGERAGVTTGKNMDGFLALAKDIVRLKGLDQTEICL